MSEKTVASRRAVDNLVRVASIGALLVLAVGTAGADALQLIITEGAIPNGKDELLISKVVEIDTKGVSTTACENTKQFPNACGIPIRLPIPLTKPNDPSDEKSATITGPDEKSSDSILFGTIGITTGIKGFASDADEQGGAETETGKTTSRFGGEVDITLISNVEAPEPSSWLLLSTGCCCPLAYWRLRTLRR